MHSTSQVDCDCREKLQTGYIISNSAVDKCSHNRCSHNRCSQYRCSHNSALHNMTEVVSPAKKRSSQATESASKWLVGSSSSSTSGLSSNSRASATLLTSPPLKLSTMLSPASIASCHGCVNALSSMIVFACIIPCLFCSLMRDCAIQSNGLADPKDHYNP